MADRGRGRKPDPSPSEALAQPTAAFEPLPSASGTLDGPDPGDHEALGDTDDRTDPPRSAQTDSTGELPVPTLPPELQKTVNIPPAPRGASKRGLPQVPPRASKSGLPAVPPRASKGSLPQVPPKASRSGLPQVPPRASKNGLQQVPPLGPPPKLVGQKTAVTTRDGHNLARTDPVYAPPATAAESPTRLRPSLGTADDNPTGDLPMLNSDDGSTRIRPALSDTDPPDTGSAPSGPRQVRATLEDDPGLSTMGRRSLRQQSSLAALLDQKTRFYLLAAVGGTFALLLLVWGLTAPKKLPPAQQPLRVEAQVRTGPPEPARPAEPSKGAEAVALEKKDQAIFISEQVDAGAGALRTVQVEGAVVTIITTPDTTVSRNGAELGKTPLTVTLPVGSIPLLFTNKALGLARTATVEVFAGSNPNKMLSFARGRLEVRAPKGTRVSVDGRGVGTVPLGEVALWPGQHQVEVIFPKGDRDRRRVEIRAGDLVAVDFDAPTHDTDLSR